MRTTGTGWLLSAALAAASTILAPGCSGHRAAASTHPPTESQNVAALPIDDPSAKGTARADRAVPGIDQVTVKLARLPNGGMKVLEILSPDLSDVEKDELRQAIERGEARPEFEPERPVSIWTTTVIRRR